jgi:hypothetical protein
MTRQSAVCSDLRDAGDLQGQGEPRGAGGRRAGKSLDSSPGKFAQFKADEDFGHLQAELRTDSEQEAAESNLAIPTKKAAQMPSMV